MIRAIRCKASSSSGCFLSRTPVPPPFLVDELDRKELDAFERSIDQMGSFRKFGLRFTLPLSLFQSHPRASAVLLDELDAGEL